MDARDAFADAFDRVRQGVGRVTDGLDADALAFRPDAEANSIAWLVWHLTRVHDDHVAEIADREQTWTSDGFHERCGLPFDAADTGYGHSSQQVGEVRFDDPQLLVDYHEAVFAQTRSYLETVDADEFDRIIDRRWDPPVTVGARLVSVINDQMQHIGQAGYVRGMWERSRAAAQT